MRRRALRWSITLALLALDCAPVKRRPERTTFGVDASYGVAVLEETGCEGERFYERHQQGGTALRVRHESAEGLSASARAWMTVGVLDEATFVGPFEDQPSVVGSDGGEGYVLWGVGGALGKDWRHVGLEGGLHLLGHGTEVAEVPVPFARVKLGNLDIAWFEGTIGPDDPQLYVNLLALGLGLRRDHLRLRAGMSIYGRLLDSQQPEPEGTSGLRLGASDDGAIGLYVDAELAIADRLGLALGAILGPDAPAARVGLSFHFGDP